MMIDYLSFRAIYIHNLYSLTDPEIGTVIRYRICWPMSLNTFSVDRPQFAKDRKLLHSKISSLTVN